MPTLDIYYYIITYIFHLWTLDFALTSRPDCEFARFYKPQINAVNNVFFLLKLSVAHPLALADIGRDDNAKLQTFSHPAKYFFFTPIFHPPLPLPWRGRREEEEGKKRIPLNRV